MKIIKILTIIRQVFYLKVLLNYLFYQLENSKFKLIITTSLNPDNQNMIKIIKITIIFHLFKILKSRI